MGDDEKIRTSSRRTGPVRAIDESTIKGIIEKAVKDLATKEYMEELISNLVRKLESKKAEKIELATNSLVYKIIILENKLSICGANMQELEVQIDNAEPTAQ